MIAASISNCLVGYKVISAAINGFWQVAKKSISAFISLYSGKYLPAYLYIDSYIKFTSSSIQVLYQMEQMIEMHQQLCY